MTTGDQVQGPTSAVPTYAVIGAGAAGLTAAKNLLEAGVDVVVLEAGDDLGGTWNYGSPQSGVYRSIHTITSKRFTEYTDFPLPPEYPTFIGHRHAVEYLRAYAAHHGVTDRIRYGSRVVEVERHASQALPWVVRCDDGSRQRFTGLVICNGHLSNPKQPSYPGSFDGLMIHSRDYRTPEILRDRRVLVIGAGNSGCDIAVEASQNASHTMHSTRRGYHYWPKYLFGLPSDVVYEWGLRSRGPLPVRRALGRAFLRLNSAGNPQQYGLPKPAHQLYDEHFIINSTLMYALGHGDIEPVPDVAELMGDRVRFTDGQVREVDVIVCATGYHLSEFPFIHRKHLNWGAHGPDLFMQAFHPVYDDLFVIGYFQTSTGNWPLMDHQSQVMAHFVAALHDCPAAVEWFRERRSRPGKPLDGGLRYYDSTRHRIEVEHFTFRRELQRLTAGMRRAGARLPGRDGVTSAAHASSLTTLRNRLVGR